VTGLEHTDIARESVRCMTEGVKLLIKGAALNQNCTVINTGNCGVDILTCFARKNYLFTVRVPVGMKEQVEALRATGRIANESN